jgi:putative ABC transport system permease protein
MKNVFKIAVRNLLRYKRRTLLTSLLIVLGVVLVIVFSGVSVSFKSMMIGQLTDSMLGHFQIHKKGYVSSVDNLPLHLNLEGPAISKVRNLLEKNGDALESYSFRLKFGAMLSNYQETTNIRLTGVDPVQESMTCPGLPSRILESSEGKGELLKKGGLLVPENLAKGLKLQVGDEVVLVATNKDGSVNGFSLTVTGIIEGLNGPGGRDGYVHIDDAKELLRISGDEINEIAVRLKNMNNLGRVKQDIADGLSQYVNKQGNPAFELHDWAALTPFSTIASIVDILIYTVKIVLISIVLISILNVMMMSVYERVSEIGTIAAIGTAPAKILSLFLVEGFILGAVSTALGTLTGVVLLFVINTAHIHFSFGRMKDILLVTSVSPGELITVSAIVIVITLISSFQPALKASKMEPVDALRHV